VQEDVQAERSLALKQMAWASQDPEGRSSDPYWHCKH
jgi:hypothetical protein